MFSWSATNMPDIDLDSICHKHSVCSEEKLVAQRWQKLGEERERVVKEEFEKLVRAGFIREVAYKHCDGQEIQQKVDDVCWLHWPQQSLPEVHIPTPLTSTGLSTKLVDKKIWVSSMHTRVIARARCTHRMKVRLHSSLKMKISSTKSCLSIWRTPVPRTRD